MPFPCRWIAHFVVDGRCRDCKQPMEGTGTICLRLNTSTGVIDMRYRGTLQWAKPCTL